MFFFLLVGIEMFFDENILGLEFFFVENVFAKTCTNTFQVGDVIGIFLDWFHLFIEEFGFQIIGKVRIAKKEETMLAEIEENRMAYLYLQANACNSSRAW